MRRPIVVALGVLLLLPAIAAVQTEQSQAGGSTVPGAVNIGDGFFTQTPVQQVSASLAWDNFFCQGLSSCANAIGVAYVPAGNAMVISEQRCNINCNASRNALVEYNATTDSYGTPLGLGCIPEIPFSPGVGDDYFVPCANSSQSSILAVNVQTNSVVGNIPSPLEPLSMAYDSLSGVVYVGASTGGAMEVFNPTSNHLVGTLTVPGGSFVSASAPYLSAYTLVYDSATDHLILPSANQTFLVVDPGNGTVATSVPLPAPVDSLAIDPASNQLFVATTNPATSGSVLSVFNARTYALDARLQFPRCVDNVCATPNPINQILVDPSHGDAYLTSIVALFTLNLSTLSVVGVAEDYGNGAPETATYLPSLDQVISTYSIFQLGPGLMAQLHHGSVTVLSSLLWLPPDVGALVIGLLCVGGIVAAAVVIRTRRRRRKEPPGSLPQSGADHGP